MLKVEAGKSHPLVVSRLFEFPHFGQADLAQQPCIHIGTEISRNRRSGEMSHPLNMAALIIAASRQQTRVLLRLMSKTANESFDATGPVALRSWPMQPLPPRGVLRLKYFDY